MDETWRSRAVAWAFAHFYQQGAWAYDAIAALISQGYWVPWIRAALPYLQGRILELGCGTGHLQTALASRAANHIGMDLSPAMLRITRRRLHHLERPGRLIRARAQRLPFPDAEFDRVVTTFPAEYIRDLVALKEIHRVLRPGGAFLIVDAGQLPDGLASTIIEGVYRLLFGYRGPDPLTIPERDPRRPLLASIGFELTERWASVGQSQVQILYAEKPCPHPSGS